MPCRERRIGHPERVRVSPSRIGVSRKLRLVQAPLLRASKRSRRAHQQTRVNEIGRDRRPGRCELLARLPSRAGAWR